MKNLRIIPRLDIKGPNVVKGINLEGLRVVGNPSVLARKYYEQGADELLYIDIVASLYERNNLLDIVEKTATSGVFIPITVGGGLRTIEDIKKILRAGADKIAINTAATRNPKIISDAANIFGTQCIVGSIQAKYKGGIWEAYVDNGRECTGINAMEWAKELVKLGVGELLITSVDKEGTEEGYDVELVNKITTQVSVPVIACGGAGNEDDLVDCFNETKCNALAMASILHYDKTTIERIKNKLAPYADVRKVQETLSPENQTRKKVSIIDYGAGNLRSVMTAFETLNCETKVINTPEEVLSAELLVLPGDGAFGYGMEQLHERNLINAIRTYISKDKPFIGICLGMQLMLSESFEFGHHKGLDIVKGAIVQLKQKEEVNAEDYTIPHMRWNALETTVGDWDKTILKGIPDKSEAYFIHSFCVYPDDISVSIANTQYGGQKFCTVLKKRNAYGTQFHPEKSGIVGLRLLYNLLNE